MLHAIVMAGGSGTRFWPKSRRSRPKQLLNLLGDRSMLQQTLDRIAPLIPIERVLIITGSDQVDAVRAQLPDLDRSQVVGEPCPRDTGPCVALAAGLVASRDPDATMLVLSADHRIEPATAFRDCVQVAVDRVANDPSTFVVFGIKPTRPETGYGYIECGDPVLAPPGHGVWRVRKFREKPDHATAESYLAAGRFFWNAGIFVWKASAVLDALAQYHPEITERLDRIVPAMRRDPSCPELQNEFPAMTRIPIDRAVMEQYPNVQVIEATYLWNDVGDWRSLAELLEQRADGNAATGPAHMVHTSRTLVVADQNQPIVTLGVDDLVIVQSGGITLVARKDRLDELKALVGGLADAGLGEYL